jgi:hypothetical protein
MKKYFPLLLLTIGAFSPCLAQNDLITAYETDYSNRRHSFGTKFESAELLNSDSFRGSYQLFQTIPFHDFTVKIWAESGFSFPGPNHQIIEIRKHNQRVSIKQVGGEPVLVDAWAANTASFGDHNNPINGNYLYLECVTRNIGPNHIFAYRINDDLTISAAAVFVDKEAGHKAAQYRDVKHMELRRRTNTKTIP